MTRHNSDSLEQRNAEQSILSGLALKLSQEGIPINFHQANPPHWNLKLDGYSSEPLIFVEAWARVGKPASSQQDKVMTDILKMQYAETLAGKKARKILAVMSEECIGFLKDTTWKGQALQQQGVEVIVVDVPPETKELVRQAQTRQGMQQSRSPEDAAAIELRYTKIGDPTERL